MKYFGFFAILFILLILLESSMFAQDVAFGKNKVQYKKFEWEYIQSDHFDVYYSQDGYELAIFTAYAAEEAYKSISKLMQYELANRIAIVVYNSHNDFQQTNVLDEYMEEGIGGVTELFKNRVVVPFEGNYKQFRHVIHHELVHGVINDMFYGGTIQSLVSSRSPLILPTWLNEGLAEYSSLHYDTNTDMFIRDATTHNYLPPIDRLDGYFAYRGGQDVWYYISNKYGEQKIGEILNRIKGTRSVDEGLKSTIGLTVKELSERWEKEAQKTYYPDVAKREEPEDFAHRLTDHTKLLNFYNSSPSISPQGDKIAFLSDRDDYFDIFIMNASDGEVLDKVVNGQRTKDFEELHLVTPAITWSPDSKKIALAVKSGAEDAIMIVDIATRNQERLTFDLNGIFSVDWSRDGDFLTFVGLKTTQSDIYLYQFSSKTLTNLTNDPYSDFEPVFSPDGKTIYFSSDRGNAIAENERIMRLPHTLTFTNRELYSINCETKIISRLTDFPIGSRISAVPSSDGKNLLVLSDQSGITNIYDLNLATRAYRPITNSISEIAQISVSYDASKLVFSSLSKAGFDIFMLRAPFERKTDFTELEPTEFIKKQFLNRSISMPDSLKAIPSDKINDSTVSKTAGSDSALAQPIVKRDTIAAHGGVIIVSDTSETRQVNKKKVGANFNTFIFTQRAMGDTVQLQYKPINIENNVDAEGNFIPHKYKLSFTPDLVYGTAAFSTFYGVQGMTLLAFSDMLGDHRLIFQTNLMIDLKNSDYGLSYYYLPYRIDYGLFAFHSARFLNIYNENIQYYNLYRFRTWGVGVSASYPIDRFNRLDFSATWLNLLRENLDFPDDPTQSRSFILPTISYVHDNTLWQGGWFGPNNGSRYMVSFMGTNKYSSDALEFYTMTMDYRSYNKWSNDFVFVYRLTGGLSNGADRQSFFIGGTEGWINRTFDRGDIPIKNVEDYAFLSPVLPLRGYNYNVLNGTRFALANLEIRFPMIRYLIFGALPIGFANMMGAMFFDMGSAWSVEDKWRATETDADGNTRFNDLLMGTGFGLRLFFFGLPIRIDVGWQIQYSGFSEPVWYFSLGPEF